MYVRKIEYLSSGNTLLLGVNADGQEVVIKAFFHDSGASIVDNDRITIARQNGSDAYTFPWNKVDRLIGKSGALPKPTSVQELYKILFEEFFINPQAESLNNQLVALDAPLAQDAKALPTRTDDYFDEIIDGKRTGITAFSKFGQNANITTTPQVIASFGGAYFPMLTADTLRVKSSSPLDTLNGDGCQKVKIVGLSPLGLLQEEIIDLNGEDFVPTTKQWLGGVNRVTVHQAGTQRTNVGTIDVLPSGETDLTKLQAQIPARIGTTKQLIFHVPADSVLKIYAYIFNGAKSGGGSDLLDINGYIFKDGIVTNFFDSPITATANPLLSEKLVIPLRFEGLASIWFDSVVAAGTGRISGRLQQTLTQLSS